MDQVDLSGAWSTFWNALTGSVGAQLTNALSIIGVALLVFTLAAYFWKRARNKSGDTGALWWTLAVGAAFAAPGVVFPILLGIVDIVANAAISLYNAT